jgi:hypothetical protein
MSWRGGICAAALLSLPALRAGIDVVRAPLQPDARRPELTVDVCRMAFDRCSLDFRYTLSEGKVCAKAWGDYFFGLRLGESPRNGGWSRWEFLRVYEKTARGTENVLSRSRPEVVLGYAAGGADRLVLEWATATGRVRLRFAAFASHPEWLFGCVDLTEAPVARVEFSAYPGNAAAQEGRVRCLGMRGVEADLSARPFETRSWTLPAVLLFSRHFDTSFGNKLVFLREAVSCVSAPKTGTRVDLRLAPAPGAKRLTFALGSFAHRDPDDQIFRFLGEEADAIEAFLREIDWQAQPSSEAFRASVGIAARLGVARSVLSEIVSAYRKAAAARDYRGMTACGERVADLRRACVEKGLEAFGKKPVQKKNSVVY